MKFNQEKYIKKCYQSKTKHKQKYLCFSLSDVKTNVTYRDVLRGQSEVYRPFRSKWTQTILKCSILKTKKKSIKIKLPFHKSKEELKQKSIETNRNYNNFGLNRTVLLTNTNNTDYIVIDGNHRFSNFILYPYKSEWNVYVGIVQSDIFEKWKKWDRNPLIIN